MNRAGLAKYDEAPRLFPYRLRGRGAVVVVHGNALADMTLWFLAAEIWSDPGTIVYGEHYGLWAVVPFPDWIFHMIMWHRAEEA